MEEKTFWGEKSEYGPFTAQEDGWPNAGEVMRHYRRKLPMSAEKLAELYGKTIGEQITARWILKMEQQNKIPLDITRRRVLAKILNIPPLLLGLSSLEQVAHNPTIIENASQTLTYSSFDLEWYSKEARVFWKLHYAQTAQDVLPDLLSYIHKIAPIQQKSRGDVKRQTSELLNSYYRLAATILRDRGKFEDAYTLANQSVRMAKEMGKDPVALQVISASQYTRGVVSLAWGAFGSDAQQGKVTLEKEKIEAAFVDFDRALKHASPQLKGIIYSEMSRAKGLTSDSLSDITIALKLIEQAEQFKDVDESNDFYTQILLNGDLKGLDTRRIILGRAKTFQAIKRPAKVLEELADLEMVNEGPSHTRRRAWTQVLHAQAAFALGDYSTAIDNALGAFMDCREVHSITHLARVNELYTNLRKSPYKDNSQVKRLGRLLGEVFPRQR
jgi:tetratricopeptide (TPR) repeat protein